jgi:hypothetical protein
MRQHGAGQRVDILTQHQFAPPPQSGSGDRWCGFFGAPQTYARLAKRVSDHRIQLTRLPLATAAEELNAMFVLPDESDEFLVERAGSENKVTTDCAQRGAICFEREEYHARPLTLRQSVTDSGRALCWSCVVPRQPAKPKPIAQWQISRIGKVARYIGTVRASDADAAILRAFEKFEVPPE